MFRAFDVERVQARCKVENVASARVMEKLGMRYEGTLRSLVFHGGRYWDVEYRSVLRGEWAARRLDEGSPTRRGPAARPEPTVRPRSTPR